MTKRRAFCLHLIVSGVVAATLVCVLVRLWYPFPFFVADGGWQGLRLVIAADIGIGPLLTLVVYNPRKTRRALLFDYSVIAALQMTAFSLGAWTVFDQRTAMAIFTDGAFYTLESHSAASLGENATRILRQAPAAPAYAAVRLPENLEARQTLRREALATGRPLFKNDGLLVPLEPSSVHIIEEHEATTRALLELPDNQPELREFLSGREGGARELLFAPLVCRYANLVVALERPTAKVVGWFPLRSTKAAPNAGTQAATRP